MQTLVRAGWLSIAVLAAVARTQPPTPLDDMALGLKAATSSPINLGETPSLTIVDIHGQPRLVWHRTADTSLPMPNDPAGAEAWLGKVAADLQHGPFRARFATREQWHEFEVLVFELRLDGVELFDAEVRAFFGPNGCIGLLNRIPPLPQTAPTIADRDGDIVWFVRRPDDVLILAERRRTQTETHDLTELVSGTEVLYRLSAQRQPSVSPAAAVFTEYTFPGMNFPDQIWADSKGLIWFSEPSANRVSVFDPTTTTFRSIPTTGYQSPDGLSIDDEDRVWTGLYGRGNGLGMIDASTGTFTRYAPPYANATMAIPVWSAQKTIWVTDHVANRISEFDPATNTWLQSMVMPTSSVWVVEGDLEPETGDIFFSEFNANNIGRLRPGQGYTQLATPSRGGPAFPAVADGKVYFTYWNLAVLGEYDTKTNVFTDHALLAGEIGGPIGVAPNGHVIVGTRNQGYVVVFDPITRMHSSHRIPTNPAGLKDGLTVAPDGVIWITESSRNKIAKLVLP